MNISELYQTGGITKAQVDASKKYQVQSHFVTQEGKLVIITHDHHLVSITRHGTIWMQYSTKGKYRA